jgi:3-oxoacyl-[acyl-carrier protein] reductase
VLIGCIINVSSLMATKMGAGAAVYAASKAGVVGMFMIYP